MNTVATDLRQDLEDRLTRGVRDSFRAVTGSESYRVSVDDQRRHKGRMATVTVTLWGEGWLGTAALLVPSECARAIVLSADGERLLDEFEENPERPVRGTAVAEVLSRIVAGAALHFGSTFSDETQFTVGPPTCVLGDATAVVYPWGQPFESRVCFESSAGPFWVVLRLTQMSG